jgi:hypothetical protein
MMREAISKRVRPGLPSIAFAALITAGSVCTAVALLGTASLAFSLLPMAAVLAVVTLVRFGQLERGLPEPYGRGEESQTGPRQAFLQGLLLIAGGAAFIFAPFVLLFYVGGAEVVGGVLGVVGGLTLSQLVFFARVSLVEKWSDSRVCTRSELLELNGEQVLLKSLYLQPEERGGEGA